MSIHASKNIIKPKFDKITISNVSEIWKQVPTSLKILSSESPTLKPKDSFSSFYDESDKHNSNLPSLSPNISPSLIRSKSINLSDIDIDNKQNRYKFDVHKIHN